MISFRSIIGTLPSLIRSLPSRLTGSTEPTADSKTSAPSRPRDAIVLSETPYQAGQELRFILGRDQKTAAGVVMPFSTTISRRHAEILIDSTGTFIRDLGSRSGTAVGPTRIGEGWDPLQNGAIIYLAKEPFTFHNNGNGIYLETVPTPDRPDAGKAKKKREAAPPPSREGQVAEIQWRFRQSGILFEFFDGGGGRFFGNCHQLKSRTLRDAIPLVIPEGFPRITPDALGVWIEQGLVVEDPRGPDGDLPLGFIILSTNSVYAVDRFRNHTYYLRHLTRTDLNWDQWPTGDPEG